MPALVPVYRTPRRGLPVWPFVLGGSILGAVLLAVALALFLRGASRSGPETAAPPNVQCPLCGAKFHINDRDTRFPRSLNVRCQCPSCLHRGDAVEFRATLESRHP